MLFRSRHARGVGCGDSRASFIVVGTGLALAPSGLVVLLDLVEWHLGRLGELLARRLPPLLAQHRRHRQRIGLATRYGEWRGTPGAGPDVLDRLEAELIASRMRRLVGVGVASIVGLALALAPLVR